MVLNASDYKLPKPGEKLVNPGDAGGTATRVVGLIVTLAFLVWAFRFSQNRGVPFIDRFAGRVGLQSTGGGTWEGW